MDNAEVIHGHAAAMNSEFGGDKCTTQADNSLNTQAVAVVTLTAETGESRSHTAASAGSSAISTCSPTWCPGAETALGALRMPHMGCL